jgi:hypothetical protein
MTNPRIRIAALLAASLAATALLPVGQGYGLGIEPQTISYEVDDNNNLVAFKAPANAGCTRTFDTTGTRGSQDVNAWTLTVTCLKLEESKKTICTAVDVWANTTLVGYSHVHGECAPLTAECTSAAGFNCHFHEVGIGSPPTICRATGYLGASGGCTFTTAVVTV